MNNATPRTATRLTHTAGATSATTIIRSDHARVLAQFRKLGPETPGTVREAIMRSVCTALEIHAQIEEELFYPALQDADVRSPALDDSVADHDEMRRLIARVRDPALSTERDNTFNELMNGVMHHVADEETQLLPAAEVVLGPDVLSTLGAQMKARSVELARPRAAEIARDLAQAAPGKAALLAVGAVLTGAVLLRAARVSRRAAQAAR